MARQREEEDGEDLLQDQTLTLTSHLAELRTEIQIPRNLKLVASLPLRCYLRQDFTYGDRRSELQLQLRTNTIQMPLATGLSQWKSQLLRLI